MSEELPPEDRARIDRALRSVGVDEATLPSTAAEAINLASDAVLGRGERYSLAELASETGADHSTLRDMWTHLGVSVADDSQPLFTDADLELSKFMDSVLGAVVTPDEASEVLHVVATALAGIAEAAVSSHIQGPERRVVAEHEDPALNAVAHVELNAAITEIGLELGRHLGAAFRHHLRQAARRNRATQNFDDRELVTLAVGFVDLVGFTGLSQQLSASELTALVREFERTAHELAHENNTRIVKLIGDEVMFVSADPEDAAAFARAMLATFSKADVVPRGGLVMGDVVNVHGDYFGPVVNLAARLVDTAVPGEVLVDDSVADYAPIPTEPSGRRMLKGFSAPIRVHTLDEAQAVDAEGRGPT